MIVDVFKESYGQKGAAQSGVQPEGKSDLDFTSFFPSYWV